MVPERRTNEPDDVEPRTQKDLSSADLQNQFSPAKKTEAVNPEDVNTNKRRRASNCCEDRCRSTRLWLTSSEASVRSTTRQDRPTSHMVFSRRLQTAPCGRLRSIMCKTGRGPEEERRMRGNGK